MTIDLDQELRAYEMLRFVPYQLDAPYSEELAMNGFYSKLYRLHSDEGLAELEESAPYTRSPELEAFYELERMGVYTQNDYYSPSKARNAFYTKQLEQLLGSTGLRPSNSGNAKGGDQAGQASHGGNQGRRPRRARRNRGN